MGAQVSYRWSLLSVSVSFTHTIKTLGPMFTILFSWLLLHERLSFPRLLAVLPVVLGVAITTSTEVEFALVGFCCAVSSTVCQAHRRPPTARSSHPPSHRTALPRCCWRRPRRT